MPEAELLILSLGTPLLLGVYVNGELREEKRLEGKAGDLLPPAVEELDGRYRWKRILFARGPGSFMAVKIGYLFARTFAVARDLELAGTDAFAFNGGAPIKATGKMHYVKEGEAIRMAALESAATAPFLLPQTLYDLPFDQPPTPLYVAPPV